jgi:hypothetical protein
MVHKEGFVKAFLRFEHTCVKNFYVGIRDRPFLRYLLEREIAFPVLNISFDLPKTMEYGLVDSFAFCR